MQSTEQLDEIWQDRAIESIINFVRSADGDFNCIEKLANAVSDPDSLQKIVEFLSSTSQGKQAFQKRPLLGNIDLQKLHRLPTNSLGYSFANHLLTNNLQPLQPKSVENDYEFFAAHITETHDLWHIVTGCDTNILGEIQLEAFYVAQLYASRFWLALITKNLLKTVIYDIELSTTYMDALAKGWVMAKQAKPLFGIEWNLLWETPLEDVRNSLNIILPNG
nr:Coq4 family protein [Dendronalium sp. ChiSLP03b]MDZ8204935.1 Coq4 family protein [Dendronalium sp. ChiSLP03b]